MDISWIKITTNIFDDEKIMLIESLPEGDSIIVIWFKLLTLAGKSNNNGVFMVSDKIPYTDEMLATIFRRPLNIIRLAIATFEKFGMIEIIDGVVTLPNWEKHQSTEGMEKVREQSKIRMQKYRAKQKAIIEETDVKTENVTLQLRNVTVQNKNKNKNTTSSDEKKNENKIIYDTYFQNCKKLYDEGKIKVEKPVLIYPKIGSLIKKWKEQGFTTEQLILCINNAMYDSWNVKQDYQLSIILSESQIGKLINQRPVIQKQQNEPNGIIGCMQSESELERQRELWGIKNAESN